MASSASASSPLSFPDPVIECICSLFEKEDLLNLSLVSKEVKDDYDGKVAEACFYWHEDLPVASFANFVRRQSRLRDISIGSKEIFPSFLESLGQGCFNLLEELNLLEAIPTDQLSTLAGLIAGGALPLLTLLETDERHWERGGVPAIMAGFQAGGCPLLKYLHVPIRFLVEQDEEDEDYGVWDGQPQYDEEETERNLEAIANAFEARAAAGIKPRLQRLDSDWLGSGSVEVRIRLLRVLLPSVIVIPSSHKEWDVEIAKAFKDITAPSVKQYTIKQNLPVLVEVLETMKSLVLLNLQSSFLGSDCTEEWCSLMELHKHSFLPNLETLSLRFPFFNAVADTKRFFECVHKNEPFRNLKDLFLKPGDGLGYDVVADVFSADVFPLLERLALNGLNGGFASLCQALARPSYAKSLKLLAIQNRRGIDGEEIQALANVFASGGLYSLDTLDFTCDDSAGIVCLANGFLAANQPLSLENVELHGAAVNDAGLGALCSAIEAGRLPALENIRFSLTSISDNGLTALAQTIEGGHLPNLTEIYIDAKGEVHYKEGAILFAKAVAAHCPELECLYLFAYYDEATESTIEAILSARKDIKFFLN